MSFLTDFLAGAASTAKQELDQKEADEREYKSRKAEIAERLAEDNRRRKLDAKDRKEELALTDSRTRDGEGYNPSTGLVEWITRGGEAGSRQATAAERNEYESSLLAAATKKENDELSREVKRSQINRNNTPRSSGRGSDRPEASPRPVTKDNALQMLGLSDVPAEGTTDHVLYMELLRGKLFPQEIDDRKRVIDNQQTAAQESKSAGLS